MHEVKMWVVDLGGYFRIDHIRIYNRWPEHPERLRDAWVVLHTEKKPRAKHGRKKGFKLTEVRRVYDLRPEGYVARYVRIQKYGEFLHVGGLAVNLTARILDLAGAGEILVSGAVPAITIGSAIEYEARGVHELRGVPGRWPVLRARPG